jgi:cytochrome c oxidase subunit 4
MSDEHAHTPAGEHAAHAAHAPHFNCWIIFAVLCVLTLVSALADKMGDWGYLNKGVLLTFVVLAVACAKALFVMLYFMHLKFEGKWKFVLLAPTIVLAMAIPAALMPDVGSHYYDYQVPQTMPGVVPEEGASHGGHSAGGHEKPPQSH